MANNEQIPALLQALLKTPAPSGFEGAIHVLLDQYIKPHADTCTSDGLGNYIATLNPSGKLSLLLAGHMDEIALQINYVDKNGFLYFETIGGHDMSVISGRAVSVLNEQGPVPGVTGRRAIHLLDEEERKKVPKKESIWIDIGVHSKEEALERVSIGDPVVYQSQINFLANKRISSKALDNRSGCYTVCETLIRLKSSGTLKASVTTVATAQEEIGTRGAITAGFGVQPDVAIAVDVGHATDYPECNPKRFGEFYLGKGPILARGPNIHPWVFTRLVQCAKANNIPFQVEAESRPASNDARSIQVSRAGVPTGIVSIPLRYMHTPNEVVALEDIENAVSLLTAFALSLSPESDKDSILKLPNLCANYKL